MTTLATKAPHHLPAGERGLPIVDTVEAVAIAARWISPTQCALTAFATGAPMDAAERVAAVREVRCEMGEHPAHELRLLLVHLQMLCEVHHAEHDHDQAGDEETGRQWCWCLPFTAASAHPGPGRRRLGDERNLPTSG